MFTAALFIKNENMESTQMLISKRLEKDVVSLFNGIPLSLKKGMKFCHLQQEDPYEGYYAQGNTSQRKTEAACYHLQVKSKTEQEDNITR